MRDEAEALEDDEIVADIEEAEDKEPAADEASQESGATEDDGEIEIVLEEEGSQPKAADLGIRKRINKLNTKIQSAKEETSEERRKREALEQENEILKLRLQQSSKPSGPPNPDDFDNGEDDPAFKQAQSEHQRQLIQEEVARRQEEALNESEQRSQQLAAQQKLEAKQVEHYQRAEKLKVSDYEALEDAAIEVLGNDITNQIIQEFDKSEMLLAYIGKNPDEGKRIAQMVESGSAIRAVAYIGRLEATLQVRPKTKPAPDPDEEVTGSAPAKKDAGVPGVIYE